MAKRIESEEVAKGLPGDDRARNGFFFRRRLLYKNFQGFPCATAETCKQFSVIKKIPAEDFGDTEDEMTMGHILEDIHAQPFPEFHHALLVAGRAEMAAFTREGKQIFVAAVFAFHTDKAVAQIAAIQMQVLIKSNRIFLIPQAGRRVTYPFLVRFADENNHFIFFIF